MKLSQLSIGVVLTLFSTSSWSMEYVKVCNEKKECKNFSRLVMGTDHLVQGGWQGPQWHETKEEELFEILDETVKQGINFYDTSPIYVGGIEYKLGKWLQSRKKLLKSGLFQSLKETDHPDKDLYALSKGGFPFDLFWSKRLEQGTHSSELKQMLSFLGILNVFYDECCVTKLEDVPAGTYASRLFGDLTQIEERLKEELKHTVNNLNGNIAVYLMHRDDADFVNFSEVKREQTPVERILKALSNEEISSKFWSIGWSNWRNHRVTESLALANENPSFKKPLINSPYFSLFEMSKRSIHAGGIQVTHKEMMDPNFQKGIKIMPYSPLGGFSILDKPEPRWENGKKAAKEKFDAGDPYWKNVFHAIFTKENEARYYRVVKFTNEFNLKHETSYTLDQMINAYALAHPRTDLLAIGPITKEQLKRTVGALTLSKMLTHKDLDYLYSGREW